MIRRSGPSVHGLKEAPFGHNAEARVGALRIVSSYHCSRYNTNTGVLTVPMFEAVFERASQGG